MKIISKWYLLNLLYHSCYKNYKGRCKHIEGGSAYSLVRFHVKFLFGKDLFYKENYPSMRINVDGEKIFIEGFYNKGEEKFIADYFLKYGKNLISVEPIELKKLITDRGREIFEYFYKL